MLSGLFDRFFGSTGDGDAEDPSRRRFLLGLAAVGAAAATGASLLPEIAEAGERMTPIPAQYGERRYLDGRGPYPDDRRYYDDDWRRGGYRDDRRRRRDRWSRREIRALCREDRWFRRDNRQLCRSVEGRGRQGACVQIGPFVVCD